MRLLLSFFSQTFIRFLPLITVFSPGQKNKDDSSCSYSSEPSRGIQIYKQVSKCHGYSDRSIYEFWVVHFVGGGADRKGFRGQVAGVKCSIRMGQGRLEGRGDGSKVNSKLVSQTWTPQPLQMLWEFKDFCVTRYLHSSLISYLLCSSFSGSQPCQLLKIPQMQHCFACPFPLSLPSFHPSFPSFL